MQDSKFFLRSMTVLGVLLTAAMTLWKGSIAPDEAAVLQGSITDIVTNVGIVVGLIGALVGRFRAKSGVTLLPGAKK